MFASWGRRLAAHRRLVAALSLVSLFLAGVLLAITTADLASEGWVSEDSEFARVSDVLLHQYDRSGDSIVFLFDADTPVDTLQMHEAIDAALAPLADDDRFSAVITSWSAGDPGMISGDGLTTYAVALVAPGITLENSELDALSNRISDRGATHDLAVSTGGALAINAAITGEVEKGLVRAETFSIPVTLVILLMVFGSAVAAGVPLMIGAVAILASLAVLFLLSLSIFQSIFAVNMITMLGLGLGIDYSLFMVTRFREEIIHRSTADAVAVTMATVGKAILFSGITVIFGLAATQFFDVPMLGSMGQAGMLVTALTLVYGLTLLPAVLAMLGPGVNALAIGRRRTADANPDTGFWHGIAQTVMRRPVLILASVLVVLLVVAVPLLRLDMTAGGPEALPADDEPRVVSERLASEFPTDGAEPLPVLLTLADGAPASADNVAAIRDVVHQIGALPGIAGVESFVSDALASQADFEWNVYTGDPASLPAPIAAAVQATVRDNVVLLSVSTPASGSEVEQVVRDIREVQSPAMQIEVGGFAASAVDALNAIHAGLVPAAIFVAIGAYLILLLSFGSVFLPLKAMFMTLLSVSASLGVVVFIFQEGHLEALFDFQATGEIIATTPILMFCVLFGLSMDYEVLMLSRIQEEYELTGDNTASVAFGLSHTGKVITGAAAIMVIVFGGFMLADISIMKNMGFGLAFAVLVDATIVRGLLVPATMRLMGRWNWWAPAPVRSLVDRIGLSHHTIAPVPASET